MDYNLDHLNQRSNQMVLGAIQDDEALALYALIKCMMLKNVVEIGALEGYSANNFLKAVGNDGTVISIDVEPIKKIQDNHITIVKNAAIITPEEIPFEIDLIFYDCHDFNAQMTFHANMVKAGRITSRTTIALHDTNLHPYKVVDDAYQLRDGWVHQLCERTMVNELFDKGWNAICLHTKMSDHNERLPYRHGLTIMKQFKKLKL
jgi:predicted O-methyltransferase YrrM